MAFKFRSYSFLLFIIFFTALSSPKTYGQKYDVYSYEPRRWIDRPGGVGDGLLDEGLWTFGFGRR